MAVRISFFILMSLFWASKGYSLGIGCEAPNVGQSMVISMASNSFTQFALHDNRSNGKIAQAFASVLEEGVTRADVKISLDLTKCERTDLAGKGELLNCGAEAFVGPMLINKCGQIEYDHPSSLYYICHQMLAKYEPATLRFNAKQAGLSFTAVIPSLDAADSEVLPFTATVAMQNPKAMAVLSFPYWQSGVRCYNSEGAQY